jgi:hypothetical protein
MVPSLFTKSLRDVGDDAECGAALDFDPQTLRASTRRARGPRSERLLDRLVRLQRADGSWELTERLANILGKKLRHLETHLAEAEGDPAAARQAWATALALRWLETEAAELADEWELLGKKARQWLLGCPARLTRGRSWMDAAAEVLP